MRKYLLSGSTNTILVNYASSSVKDETFRLRVTSGNSIGIADAKKQLAAQIAKKVTTHVTVIKDIKEYGPSWIELFQDEDQLQEQELTMGKTYKLKIKSISIVGPAGEPLSFTPKHASTIDSMCRQISDHWGKHQHQINIWSIEDSSRNEDEMDAWEKAKLLLSIPYNGEFTCLIDPNAREDTLLEQRQQRLSDYCFSEKSAHFPIDNNELSIDRTQHENFVKAFNSIQTTVSRIMTGLVPSNFNWGSGTSLIKGTDTFISQRPPLHTQLSNLSELFTKLKQLFPTFEDTLTKVEGSVKKTVSLQLAKSMKARLDYRRLRYRVGGRLGESGVNPQLWGDLCSYIKQNDYLPMDGFQLSDFGYYMRNYGAQWEAHGAPETHRYRIWALDSDRYDLWRALLYNVWTYNNPECLEQINLILLDLTLPCNNIFPVIDSIIDLPSTIQVIPVIDSIIELPSTSREVYSVLLRVRQGDDHDLFNTLKVLIMLYGVACECYTNRVLDNRVLDTIGKMLDKLDLISCDASAGDMDPLSPEEQDIYEDYMTVAMQTIFSIPCKTRVAKLIVLFYSKLTNNLQQIRKSWRVAAMAAARQTNRFGLVDTTFTNIQYYLDMEKNETTYLAVEEQKQEEEAEEEYVAPYVESPQFKFLHTDLLKILGEANGAGNIAKLFKNLLELNPYIENPHLVFSSINQDNEQHWSSIIKTILTSCTLPKNTMIQISDTWMTHAIEIEDPKIINLIIQKNLYNSNGDKTRWVQQAINYNKPEALKCLISPQLQGEDTSHEQAALDKFSKIQLSENSITLQSEGPDDTSISIVHTFVTATTSLGPTISCMNSLETWLTSCVTGGASLSSSPDNIQKWFDIFNRWKGATSPTVTVVDFLKPLLQFRPGATNNYKERLVKNYIALCLADSDTDTDDRLAIIQGAAGKLDQTATCCCCSLPAPQFPDMPSPAVAGSIVTSQPKTITRPENSSAANMPLLKASSLPKKSSWCYIFTTCGCYTPSQAELLVKKHLITTDGNRTRAKTN